MENAQLRKALFARLPEARLNAHASAGTIAQHRRSLRAAGARDGFRFPARPAPQAALHRLRWRSRQGARRLLRPAGLGSAHRRLCRGRERRHPAGKLVSHGTFPRCGRWRGRRWSPGPEPCSSTSCRALWLRTYPETMLEKSQDAAVFAQQMYARRQAHSVGHLGVCIRQGRGEWSLRLSRVRRAAACHSAG